MKQFAKEISKKYNIDEATTVAAVEAVALELAQSPEKLTEFIQKSKPIHRAHLASQAAKVDEAKPVKKTKKVT